jgi:hypothetical protein
MTVHFDDYAQPTVIMLLHKCCEICVKTHTVGFYHDHLNKGLAKHPLQHGIKTAVMQGIAGSAQTNRKGMTELRGSVKNTLKSLHAHLAAGTLQARR